MAFGAGDPVRIQFVAVMRGAFSQHRRKVFAQIDPVFTVRFTVVILRHQLQRLMIINRQCSGAHNIQAVRILKPGLGVIDQDFAAFAVIPAAVTLISHR